MPNLRQLEYLVALADTRHFRRAAERTNTTQPTLSEQIKALELRLGCQLIERSSSGAIITPVGRDVVGIARRMLADVAEIRRIAGGRGRSLSGSMKLGLPPTLGPYLMTRAGPLLKTRFPAMQLYVREDLPDALARGLEDGGFDLIIAPLPLRFTEAVVVPLFQEELLLAVASDHRLATKGEAQIADIAGEDLLMLGPGHQLHDTVVALGEQAQARLRFDFEGTSLDMLREMVAMRLGVTFVPALYAASRLHGDPEIRLLKLSDRVLRRSIGLAVRKSAGQREDFEAFADAVACSVAEVTETAARAHKT